MGKRVFIHAGAHRTGTSSLQMCLDQNRVSLELAGFDLAYPGRDGIPGGKLRLKLPGPATGAKKLPAMEQAAAREMHRHSTDRTRNLVLSEENISGRMFHFYKGLFFPAAETRLNVLKSALQVTGCDKIERIVLVLRSYEAMFVSAYRKRAEDNAVAPFHQIAPRMVAMDRGWPALIRAFKSILAPQELVVIEYRQRGESRDLINRLLPELDVPLLEPKQTLNLSATDNALTELQRRYHAGEKLPRAAWQEVISAHSKDRTTTGFAEFETAGRAQLQARYETHLDKIANIRGITLLR